MWDETFEKRDGAVHLLLGEETHDANHRQPSVVNFLDETLSLRLLGPLIHFHVIKWVEEREGSGMGEEFRVLVETRVITGSTSAHVVRSSGLGEPLKEANSEDNLPLGRVRQGIPLLGRGSGIGGERSAVSGNGPGEMNTVGLNDVSDEGGHGNTSVLDFSMAEPANCRFLGVSEDGSSGEFERVVELRVFASNGEQAGKGRDLRTTE